MSSRPAPPGLASARREGRVTTTPKRRPPSSGWDGVEVVPDSEEERIKNNPDIIELSSDEEEMCAKPRRLVGDPALQIPGAWLGGGSPLRNLPGRTLRTPATPPSSNKKSALVQTPGTPTSSSKKPSKRPQAVQSVSDDVTADQVVVLPDLGRTPKATLPPKHFYGKAGSSSPSKSTTGARGFLLSVEDSDSEIEVLDGPTLSTVATRPKLKGKQPLYADDDDEDETDTTDSSDAPSTAPSFHIPNKYAKYWTPVPAPAAGTPSGSKVQTPSKGTPSRSPKKLSQAALVKRDAEKWMAHQVEYAEQVYSYLNKVAFDDRLPSLRTIQIKWNNRLTSTAGRARFHRTQSGTETAEIELAPKVVDCDERIRNTLAHEMCHLACWMIDNEIKEYHGKLWSKWARRVEKKDSNLTISVQHTYDIYCPYEWMCASCNETVGRHHNSLDPTKTKCPSCKIGLLVAQFEDEGKQGKKGAVKKMSKHAAARPQGSPRPGRSPRPASPVAVVIYIDSSSDDEDEDLPSIYAQKEVYVVHDSDSESEMSRKDGKDKDKGEDKTIADLAREFGGITIAHSACLHARRRGRRPTTD
ncbi:SprT-like family-domain-containing protein [Mycena filopes]|nr:SprT-like family-domain-containing protein [Mycena filopes]